VVTSQKVVARDGRLEDGRKISGVEVASIRRFVHGADFSAIAPAAAENHVVS
jgi:hypothetical protein